MEEQRKYLESVTYQIDRFKASIEELANDFMSADFLKNVIKSGATLVNILDTIIDKAGSIPLLLSGIGAALSFKGVGINEDTVKGWFGMGTLASSSLSELLMPISDNDIAKLRAFDAALDDTSKSFSDAFALMEGASKPATDLALKFKDVEKGSRSATGEFIAMQEANRELNISELASSRSLGDLNAVLKIYNN